MTPSLKSNLLQQLMSMREEVLYEIFLDIHKYYDTLYHVCCIEILVEFGVGPQVLRLFQRYCYCLSMMAWYGGYFGETSKCHRGMT